MASYKHYSFDLDGTVLDTLEIMRLAWNATAEKFGLWHDFSEYKREIGIPFEAIMAHLGIADEDGEIKKHYFAHTDQLASQVKMFPHALEFINSAKQAGISTSIITSKPRENSEHLMSMYGIEVDMLICGDDHGEGKPTEQPMLRVRENLGLQSSEIIYFGDMMSDLVFAVNSQVEYCHCDFGIVGPLSDYVVPKPPSIKSWQDPWLDTLAQ